MQIKTAFQLKARLVENTRVKGAYWRCVLSAPQIARLALPGQFINLKLENDPGPLLRRPFSIQRVRAGRIEVLYEVLGPGTVIFSSKQKGERLDVIGPLGNGFAIPRLRPGTCSIIVAGGMGVAPLSFLGERLAQIREQRTKNKNIVLIGAKTKGQILCEKDFIDSGYSVKIATDDGSRGFGGYVSNLLKKELSALSLKPSVIYACGPKPMLKEVASISKKHNIPTQISLEEHMACGIGACLGCAVNTRSGFQRVCKEGPVFNAREIIW